MSEIFETALAGIIFAVAAILCLILCGLAIWAGATITFWGRCHEVHKLTRKETYVSPFLGCLVRENGAWIEQKP
jgi:hypothetical protein